VDRLAVHLRTLAPALSVWSDAAIKPGDSWQTEIEKAISVADVAILLLSADYLASDFIADQELPFLTESALRGKTLVVPIVVSPFYLPPNNPLWQFQWVNRDKPLNALPTHEQDEVFREVARVIERWLTHPPAKATQQLKEVRNSTKDTTPASRKESVAMSSALAEEVAKKVLDLLASGQSLPTGEEIPAKTQIKRPESNLVFVVSSFSDDMEPIYEGIAAAAQSAGLVAK